MPCVVHGTQTRITCADCGQPICPKCLVRTEVGTKCRPCSAPVEVRVSRGKSRWAWVLGGTGIVLAIAAIITGVLLTGGGNPKARVALPPLGRWVSQPSPIQIQGTTALVALKSGMVLAAGGGVSQIPVASAELYNPSTGSWVPTGTMLTARRGASAVLLADGRVLVAGGVAGQHILASAELYNPATGRWSVTGSMRIPRLDNTLTLLPGGNVLATGGTTSAGRAGSGAGQTIIPVSSAEIYNPATAKWSVTGSMTVARFEASATLLKDGRVLIAGGLGGPGVHSPTGLQYPPLSSAEIYDPTVGAFVGAGKMGESRADQVAALLPDGTVMVAGGASGTDGLTTLRTVERFNPLTGSWTALPPMSTPRSGAAVATLHNGSVLVAGGETDNQGSVSSLASAELFDPQSSTWRSAGSMGCARSGLEAAVLNDGSVLEVAGDTAFPGNPPVAQSCDQRYYPASGG